MSWELTRKFWLDGVEHGWIKKKRKPKSPDLEGAPSMGVWYRNNLYDKSHLHQEDGFAFCGRAIIADALWRSESGFEEALGFWVVEDTRRRGSNNNCGDCKRRYEDKLELPKQPLSELGREIAPKVLAGMEQLSRKAALIAIQFNGKVIA